MAISFLNNDVLTIDVGFRYIKVSQVRKKKNLDMLVVNYGMGDTPKNCIKNGAIKDGERVTNEIKKIINEHELQARDAKIVMSGTNIITRIILVDKSLENDNEKSIMEAINNYIPINLEEHKVDYKILGYVKEGEIEKTKVFVTAVPKKIITSYINMLKNLNLKPVAVDIPSNSISKFFQKEITNRENDNWLRMQRLEKNRTSTVAVIDLGSETTIVNILKDKMPEFNRVLLMGSTKIDEAIFKELNLAPNETEKAELYKKMYGVMQKRDMNNELGWQCSNAAKPVLNTIIVNIRQCFDFYYERCGGDRINRIYLIGGGSRMKGLREYFEEAFEIATYPINLVDVEGIEFSSSLNTEKINYLINSLGIAL